MKIEPAAAAWPESSPRNGPDYPEMPAMPQAPDGGLQQIAGWIVSHKR